MAGGALVSISGSIILYMILNIAASAGFIGDLLALYTALSPNTILLIWVFGLLLGGGAMLLQSLLMKSVEDVDDGSWEDWEPEYEEEIVIRQYPDGRILQVIPGNIMKMPDGQKWLLG